MAHIITQQDLDILNQSTQEVFLYLEVLNQDYKILDEIQGEVISANFSIDANSDVRRTCSFQIHVTDSSFLLSEDSKIWLNRLFRAYIGYRHIRTGEIVKYNQGIYVPNTYSYSYNYSDNTLSLDGSDLMVRLTSDYGGQLTDTSIISQEKGVNIRTAMIDTLDYFGKIKKYLIGDIGAEITPTEDTPDPRLLPYEIKISYGSAILELLTELRDVWVGWEIFFDVDGTFVCQMIPNCAEDPIYISETVWDKIVISEQTTVNQSDIKNHIVIYGETISTGENAGKQIKGEAKEENPESPFAISKIGDLISVKSDDVYSKIYSDDYANQRAEYELYLAAKINDSISLECLLIPWLEVNQKVSYRSQQTNEVHEYIVKSISFEVGKGTMSVEMMRFYPEFPDIVTYSK